MNDTKSKIINSYLVLGAQKGYDNISLSEIATYTGIKKASIFSHFKSYEEIKTESVNFLISTLRELNKKSINIPINNNHKIILELSLNSFLNTLISEPVIYLICMIEQKRTYNKEFKKLSDDIVFMIYSRLEVAFDLMGYSENADIYSNILTSSVNEILSNYSATFSTTYREDIFEKKIYEEYKKQALEDFSFLFDDFLLMIKK